MTLADQILFIARTGKTGTLQVLAASGAHRSFLFVEGFLAEIDSGREETVLEAALLKTDLFSDKDIKRARKLAAKGGVTLGAALLELDIVPEEEVELRLREQITSEVAEVLSWSDLEAMQFVEHAAEERLEDFQCELSDYYEIYTDVEELFIDAVGRFEDWATIEEHFPILQDVFYATPASIRFFTAQDEHPYEHAIVSTIDSSRSLQELLDEAGLDRFAGLNAARRLIAEGDLQMIDPVQMYQIGLGYIEKEQYEKAYRVFHRALDKGLREFDLELKIAELLDKMGRRDDAVAHYMRFAQKCMAEDRLDEALRTLRDVRKLDPASTVISERLIEIFLRQSRVEDATQEAMQLATRRAATGSVADALDLLERIRERNPSDLELQRKIAELASESGDQERAGRERELLEQNDSLQTDDTVALETYQKMFVDGQDTLDVRLKLVEFHRKCGNTTKALDHATALLNLSDKRRIRDEKTLVHLHRIVCELKPSDVRSNRWLVEHYLAENQKAEAVEQLLAWIAHLEREEDCKEASLAYEKLISIDDQLQHRWGYTATLEKLGQPKRALEALRDLFDAALQRKEHAQAARALESIRASWPLDIESRRRQVELALTTGQTERARQHTCELVRLAILAGDAAIAEEYAAKLDGSTPAEGHVIHDLGRLHFENGQTERALACFLESAKVLARHGDQGSSREVAGEIFAIEPQQPEATAILQEIEAALAPGTPGPAAEAAPPHRPEARAAAPTVAEAERSFAQPPEPTALPAKPALPPAPEDSAAVESSASVVAAAGQPTALAAAAAREIAPAPATASDDTPRATPAPAKTPAPTPAPTPAHGSISQDAPAAKAASAPEGNTSAAATPEARVDAAGRPLPCEPFQAPAPVKTNVSNITARLRRLKTGGGAPSRNKVTKVSSNLAKLKAMRGPESAPKPGAARPSSASVDSEPAAATTSPPAATSSEAATRTPPETGTALPASEGGGVRAASRAKLGNAASKLRALSGKPDSASVPEQNADGPPSDSTEDETPVVPTAQAAGASAKAFPAAEGGGTRAVSKAKLTSAASRLRALSGKTDAAEATAQKPETTPVADEENDTPATPAAGDADPSAETLPAAEGGGTRAVSKAKLSSAATRLRALSTKDSAEGPTGEGGAAGSGSEPSAARSPDGPASPEDDTGKILPGLPDAQAISTSEGGGTIAKKKQALGGSASKLAALRAEVEQEEHEAQPQT